MLTNILKASGIFACTAIGIGSCVTTVMCVKLAKVQTKLMEEDL